MSDILICPKCQGTMMTYNRNGVHLEQCEKCRGVFLDYGELETITRLESQWQAPPPPQPGWGAPPPSAPGHYGHHGHHRRPKSFMQMLFSS